MKGVCCPCAWRQDAYELFATSATDSTVKLWDLRTTRAVRAFAQHRNTTVPVGCAFSPCLRYAQGGRGTQALLAVCVGCVDCGL